MAQSVRIYTFFAKEFCEDSKFTIATMEPDKYHRSTIGVAINARGRRMHMTPWPVKRYRLVGVTDTAGGDMKVTVFAMRWIGGKACHSRYADAH
jgi:hypothetical protein